MKDGGELSTSMMEMMKAVGQIFPQAPKFTAVKKNAQEKRVIDHHPLTLRSMCMFFKMFLKAPKAADADLMFLSTSVSEVRE
jgi:hypothetical protein